MLRAPQDSGSPRSLADLLPPANIEAEQGVLGSVMLDPEALVEVGPVLDVEDFYRDAHQVVWWHVKGMADAGLPVDAVTLADSLERAGDLDRVGGLEFLADLAASIPHAANARYYADIVKQKADSRRVAEKANEVLRRVYSNEFTAEQLVADAQADFLAIGDRSGGSTEFTLAQAAAMALDTMDRRWRGEDPGVRIPYRRLDAMLDGFRPGRLYIVAGRPGSGKSAWCFNVATHAASFAPVLFFSLEMGAEELGERYLSAAANVNGYGFKRPSMLEKAALDGVYAAAGLAAHVKLSIDEAGALTVGQIAARARRFKHRHGLRMLVVDYLQLVTGTKDKGGTRQEEVASVSRGLRGLAKELNVPVVAACQLNRAGEGRPAADRRPRMADLRESGQLEQDAHGVLLMHRPDLDDPNDSPGLVEINVAKNRGGSTGKVTLRFVKEETRFEEAQEPAGVIPDDGNPPMTDAPY